MNRCLKYLYLFFALFLLACEGPKDPVYYSYVDALGQIDAHKFRDQGLTGKGIKIGVIDLGFAELNNSQATQHLFEQNKIAFMRQYYPDSQAVFLNHAEKHGQIITFFIGGRSKRDSTYGGALAINSEYYLAKVGKSAFENKTLSDEEENIKRALEDFYRRKVRLVNLSLGYWDDFEDASKNYSRDMMDGQSTRIARICREYIDKGMIIVTAAGNTGEFRWKYVWSPADAEDVISVGACSQLNVPFRATYSGIGNPETDFVKPDVVCYSVWGTSVSAPVITSVIALMLEKDSTLTAKQIQRILHKSGNLYPYPNNYVGYGIPDAGKILKLLEQSEYEPATVKEKFVTGNELEIIVNTNEAVLFQKTGPYTVKRQYLLNPEEGKIILKRKKGIPRSTLVVDNAQVYEIFWQ
ncbi:MAG: S8 family serine peptidase [Bacteroidales bacterium]